MIHNSPPKDARGHDGSQEAVFSTECPALLAGHFQQLHSGSGISVGVINERGYESVLGGKRLAELGFSKAQQQIPGILMPIWGVDGVIVGYQYRPDHPRLNPKGKAIKYETPLSAGNHIDCPPRCRPMLGDHSVDLWVTEGIKKGDSLASHGECAIDFAGVWSWKGRNQFGGVTILADFDHIALNGRRIYLAFDSDWRTNASVKQALRRLGEHLKRKGTKLLVINWPEEMADESR